jgi:outer membrane scaffolding protein for murein synthesis (MipA/OmpV family)
MLVALLGSLSALAQEPPAPARGESQWGLGISVGAVRKPYTDIDDDAIVLPVLLFENRWVSIAGPGIDLKLPSTDAVAFRLRARFDPGIGYEADDSPVLAGMEERKAGLWLGAALLWRMGFVDVGAEWLGDASNDSDGQRATFSLLRRFPFGAWSLTPRIEAIWLDRKYTNFYYGVRAEEATAGRGAYEADSTVNSRLGLRVDYRLMARHTLFLDASATRLGHEIEDSPIVDRSTTSAVFLGYAYLF